MVFALLFSGALWGADFSLSVGGGLFAGGLFTRYTLDAEGHMDINQSGTMVKTPVKVHSRQEMDQFSMGGSLFLDATWATFSISLQGGFNKYREAIIVDAASERPIDDEKTGTGREVMLGLTLLGKYPFKLTEEFSLFPLAGLEYQISCMQVRDPQKPLDRAQYDRTDGVRELDSNGNAYRLSMWNSLFVDIGAGMDFYFSAPLFFRAELLYAFRLQTPYEIDALQMVKDMTHADDPQLSGLTSGPTLKIGLGWRIY
jgi:hypothetical protein